MHSAQVGPVSAAGTQPPRAPTGSSDRSGLSEAEQELDSLAAVVKAGFTRPAMWVLVFGWSLACCAGAVNVIVYLRWNKLVSHMTGNTAHLGMKLQGWHYNRNEPEQVRDSLMILVCFVLGALLCGILIDKNKVHFGGKSFYGVALVLNAAILAGASLHDGPFSVYLAAAACGLQNAMCTSHFGAVVRTTHVTGTLTDIGSTIGRVLMIVLRRGCRLSRLNRLDRAEIEVDVKKLTVLLPLFVCFFLGCVGGAYLQELVGEHGLLIPAALTGSVGFVYMFFRQKMKDGLKRLERERLQRKLREVHDGISRSSAVLGGIRNRVSGQDQKLDDSEEELCGDLYDQVSSMQEAICVVEANLSSAFLPTSSLPAEFSRVPSGRPSTSSSSMSSGGGEPCSKPPWCTW